MSNFFKRTIILLIVILLSSSIKSMQDDSMQVDSYCVPEGHSIETLKFHIGAILTILNLNPQKLVNGWLSIDTREVDGQPRDRYQQVWRLAEFLSGEQWFIHETCIMTDNNGVEHAVLKVRERLHRVGLVPYQRKLEEQFPGLKEMALNIYERECKRLLDMIEACTKFTEQAKIIHTDKIIKNFLKVVGNKYFKISPECPLDDDAYFIPVTSLIKRS